MTSILELYSGKIYMNFDKKILKNEAISGNSQYNVKIIGRRPIRHSRQLVVKTKNTVAS